VDATSVAIAFLVAGILLSAVEIVAPGLVILPFGLGAVVASIVGFLGGPPLLQAVVFLVASFAFFIGLRPLARRLNAGVTGDGVGSRGLIGATAVVLADIPSGETGMVRVERYREEWRAEAVDDADLQAGDRVRVVEVQGTRLMVTAADVPPADPRLPGAELPGEETR
jgi:membrane protein implicated in regulation of membrane protease activity